MINLRQKFKIFYILSFLCAINSFSMNWNEKKRKKYDPIKLHHICGCTNTSYIRHTPKKACETFFYFDESSPESKNVLYLIFKNTLENGSICQFLEVLPYLASLNDPHFFESFLNNLSKEELNSSQKFILLKVIMYLIVPFRNLKEWNLYENFFANLNADILIHSIIDGVPFSVFDFIKKSFEFLRKNDEKECEKTMVSVFDKTLTKVNQHYKENKKDYKNKNEENLFVVLNGMRDLNLMCDPEIANETRSLSSFVSHFFIDLERGMTPKSSSEKFFYYSGFLPSLRNHMIPSSYNSRSFLQIIIKNSPPYIQKILKQNFETISKSDFFCKIFSWTENLFLNSKTQLSFLDKISRLISSFITEIFFENSTSLNKKEEKNAFFQAIQKIDPCYMKSPDIEKIKDLNVIQKEKIPKIVAQIGYEFRLRDFFRIPYFCFDENYLFCFPVYEAFEKFLIKNFDYTNFLKDQKQNPKKIFELLMTKNLNSCENLPKYKKDNQLQNMMRIFFKTEDTEISLKRRLTL
jgi:hypothetical protein